MTFNDICKALDCETVVTATDHGSLDITEVIVSDLMSDVLTVEEEDFILVTSLASEQVIRTADIVGARGVMLVNGKRPSDSMITLAREDDITLLATKNRTFPACIALGALLNGGEQSPA